MKALRITPDEDPACYDALVAEVGGWLEAVSIPGHIVYVNEEGGPDFANLPANPLATMLVVVQLAISGRRLAGNMLHGTVIILGAKATEATDVSPELVAAMATVTRVAYAP